MAYEKHNGKDDERHCDRYMLALNHRVTSDRCDLSKMLGLAHHSSIRTTLPGIFSGITSLPAANPQQAFWQAVSQPG